MAKSFATTAWEGYCTSTPGPRDRVDGGSVTAQLTGCLQNGMSRNLDVSTTKALLHDAWSILRPGPPPFGIDVIAPACSLLRDQTQLWARVGVDGRRSDGTTPSRRGGDSVPAGMRGAGDLIRQKLTCVVNQEADQGVHEGERHEAGAWHLARRASMAWSISCLAA